MAAIRQLRASSLIRWAPAVAWMAIIFFLSAQPSLPRLYGRFEELQSVAGHFVEYAILALLLRWAILGVFSARAEASAGHPSSLAFLLAVAYGITDEFHQHFVPGRHMDPLDLLVDAAGAAAALCVAGWLTGRHTANQALDKSRTGDSP